MHYEQDEIYIDSGRAAKKDQSKSDESSEGEN